MNRFPDFGKDTRRPFAVHENCYDCAEFYHTCQAWPAAKEFGCADFYRLPDAGVNGTTGQTVPASRMGGRTEPLVRRDYVEREPKPQRARDERTDKQLGPQPYHDSDGVWRCECGQVIPDRKRCCNDCREKRRKETMHRRTRQAKACQEMAQECVPCGTPAPRTV